MSGFLQKATGVSQALVGIAVAQHLYNQAMAAAAAPINTMIRLGVERDAQVRSITNALVAQQAVGATRSVQAVADAVLAGRTVGRQTAATTREIAEGTRRFVEYGDAARDAFLKSSTSSAVFTTATTASRQMMAMMVRDAAQLPGEVNDYATAMQIASSSVIQAVAGTRFSNVRSVMGLINNTTAAAINSGIDAGQAGRDIMRMMTAGRGQAALDNRTWTEVISPYAARANGQRLDASQFNALRASERFEVLNRVSQTLREIMNNSAESWEALTGTINSARDEVIRDITSPLYQRVKEGLAVFASWLNEGQEQGRSFLQIISRVGLVFTEMLGMWLKPTIQSFRDSLSAVVPWMESITRSPWFNYITSVMVVVGRLLQSVLGSNAQAVGGVLGRVANLFLLFEPGLVVFTGFLSFFRNDGAGAQAILSTLFVQLAGIGQRIMALSEYFSVLKDLIGVAWSAVSGLLASVLQVLGFIAQAALTFLAIPFTIVGAVMLPVILILAVAAGVLRMFVDGIFFVLRVIAAIIEAFTPVRVNLHTVVETLRYFITTVREMVVGIRNWFASIGMGSSIAAPERSYSEQLADELGISTRVNSLSARLQSAFRAVQEAGGDINLTSPRQRPTSTTHNDFRFSRFDITQRFAEGFDPDRVATLFQRDIANAANQRMEGGLGLAFST
jgi:hypothetical protein